MPDTNGLQRTQLGIPCDRVQGQLHEPNQNRKFSNHMLCSTIDLTALNRGVEHWLNECTSDHVEFDTGSSICGHC